MKIDVTYEKADILRLVERELRAQGLRLKPGTSLAYKGALEVKLSAEVEDERLAEAKAPLVKRRPPHVVPDDDEPAAPEVDMDAVLAASQNVAKTIPGRFPRPLINNEYMQETEDFPGVVVPEED